MKRTLVPLFAILALVLAAPLVAQSAAPPGHMDSPGATYISGTLVSLGADSIVIRTDTGETRTFLINAATVGVQSYPVGNRVKIDFVLDDQSRGIAKQILGDTSSASTSLTETTTPVLEPAAPAPAPPAVESADTTLSTETDVDINDTTDDATLEAGQNEELPATASPLPLLALLGLGAVGSGVGLSFLRRSS